MAEDALKRCSECHDKHLRATSIGISSIRSNVDICGSCKKTCSVRNDHVSNPTLKPHRYYYKYFEKAERTSRRRGVRDQDTGAALQTKMRLAQFRRQYRKIDLRVNEEEEEEVRGRLYHFIFFNHSPPHSFLFTCLEEECFV